MPSAHSARLVLVASAASALVLATAPAVVAGPSATTWYVAETGAFTGPCSQAEPCNIIWATNNAPSGTTVIIGPGTYGKPPHVITETLGSDASNVTYEGAPGEPMPVINSNKGFHFVGSSLSHVEFHTSGKEGLVGTDVSHVIAETTGGNAAACQIFGSITDSLCVATGANSRALWYDVVNTFGTVQNGTVRGVTAVATGNNGYGLEVEADDNSTIHVAATNDIFRGPGGDISVQTSSVTSQATVTVDHCAYNRTNTTGLGTPTTITSGGHNTTKAPKLDDTFAELLGSPTIDRGAADPANETDVTDGPRTRGAAPDMGASEFIPVKPTLSSLKVAARHKHSLTVSVRVNPGDLATTVRLTATHRGSHRTTAPKSAGAGAVAKRMTLTIHHLKRHTKYHLKVRAHNAKGYAVIGGKSAKTK